MMVGGAAVFYGYGARRPYTPVQRRKFAAKALAHAVQQNGFAVFVATPAVQPIASISGVAGGRRVGLDVFSATAF
jgi:hypothetical protein